MNMIESISSFMAGLGQKASKTRATLSASKQITYSAHNRLTRYPINPRFRAYGKARLDVTQRAKDELDWQALWREPFYPFPFTWEGAYRHCIEYKVDDFPAEVGFFIDFLGFHVIGFSPSYAQFTTPDGEFTFAVSAIQEGEDSTDPDSLRFQFMIQYMEDTITELEQRGIQVERLRRPMQDGPARLYAYMRTPHGVRVDFWGVPEPEVDEEEVAMQRILDELNFENQDTQVEESTQNIENFAESDSEEPLEIEDKLDEYSDEDDTELDTEDESQSENNLDQYQPLPARSTEYSRRPASYPTSRRESNWNISTSPRTYQPFTTPRRNNPDDEMQYLPLEDENPPD